jgi:carbonic anhydrase/acetyltransferase-like protein (isoleucine patch superfamily)
MLTPMKTVLICPGQGNGLAQLTESTPEVCLPFLGDNYLAYWLEHLAHREVTEVRLVATDRPEHLQELIEAGSRWGISLEVLHQSREIEPTEARKTFRPSYETDWLPEPDDVIMIDHLPGIPAAKPFESYADWFTSLSVWLPYVILSKRIGLREIHPGVWVGRRTRIAPSAKLLGPCWIGDMVEIGKNAVVGPNAFLEDHVVIEEAAEVTNSWVGPDTLLGRLTRVSDSLAWGSKLINWRTNSHTVVPDPFLMCSLSQKRKTEKRKPAHKRFAVAVQSSLLRPWEAVLSMAQKIQG